MMIIGRSTHKHGMVSLNGEWQNIAVILCCNLT